MTIFTAMTIKNNYPDNIKICSAKRKDGSWVPFMYQMKNGDIHSLLISFDDNKINGWKTEKESNNQMHNIAKEAIKAIDKKLNQKEG